jgi:hypothetical protein
MMVTIEKPFVFVSQRHYEALGDVIVPHIQQMMVNDYKLQEHWLPVGAPPVYQGIGENKVRIGNNIFMSPVCDASLCFISLSNTLIMI